MTRFRYIESDIIYCIVLDISLIIFNIWFLQINKLINKSIILLIHLKQEKQLAMVSFLFFILHTH
jgi:hypothetical protein